MTTLYQKAEADMAHAAQVYEWAYSHLHSQIGSEVMSELAGARTLEAAVKNVVAQRAQSDLRIGDSLDLSHLGLTEDQLVRAAQHRAERAERLAAITPAAQGDRVSDNSAQDAGSIRGISPAGSHANLAVSTKGAGFGGKAGGQ